MFFLLLGATEESLSVLLLALAEKVKKDTRQCSSPLLHFTYLTSD